MNTLKFSRPFGGFGKYGSIPQCVYTTPKILWHKQQEKGIVVTLQEITAIVAHFTMSMYSGSEIRQRRQSSVHQPVWIDGQQQQQQQHQQQQKERLRQLSEAARSAGPRRTNFRGDNGGEPADRQRREGSSPPPDPTWPQYALYVTPVIQTIINAVVFVYVGRTTAFGAIIVQSLDKWLWKHTFADTHIEKTMSPDGVSTISTIIIETHLSTFAILANLIVILSLSLIAAVIAMYYVQPYVEPMLPSRQRGRKVQLVPAVERRERWNPGEGYTDRQVKTRQQSQAGLQGSETAIARRVEGLPGGWYVYDQ